MNILKYYRAKDWIHYLGYILLGCLASHNLNLLNFLVGALMLAYTYSFNDYFDKKLKNKLFILPLLLSLTFLPFLTKLQILFYFIFILIFSFYSWPITYLEGRPIISTLSNSIGFLLLFFLPFTSIEKILRFLTFSLLLFLLNTAAQLIHEIVDYKFDKKIGKITTAVKLEIPSTILLLRVCLLLILICSLMLFSICKFVSLSTIFFSSYFTFLSFREKINEDFRKKFKYFGIFAGIIYLLDFT